MGALTALKSLPVIIGGVAALAAGIWIWLLKAEIADLEDDLAQCEQAKAVIEANRETLRLELEDQNRRIQQRAEAAEQAVEEQRRLTEEARQEQEKLEQTLQDRRDEIDRTHVPEDVEERIEQCEQARSRLVR